MTTLLAVACTVCAAPAFATEEDIFTQTCGNAPFAPVVPASPPTTQEAMTELKNDVTDFIKGSDLFQDCVTRVLDQGPKLKESWSDDQKKSAQRRFLKTAEKIILDNQEDKERTGNAFNVLVELRTGGKAAPTPAASKPAEKAAAPAIIENIDTSTAAALVTGTAKARPQVKPATP
ncbi:MAG TPA: hypothetical protein DCL48_00195 [Alphaproteobacteria bacterium]|nr:hypothetical protein [Alphaproteobacteria bacterium]